MMNIQLMIEYDGTAYHGWQSQDNGDTVQRQLENALFHLTGLQIHVTGSGRTDAGVHALGQVANFHVDPADCSIPPDRFSYALNRLLPQDIVVLNSGEVPERFHARFDALGKTYRYQIHNAPFRSAMLKDRAYHVSGRLDAERMTQAAALLEGTHDFKGFMAEGSPVKSTIRTLHLIEIVRDAEDTGGLCFEFTGNGFLYNMVRIMAGTLVEVGLGRLEPEIITEVLETGDRKLAGKTLPPQGLYLVKVYYPGDGLEEFEWRKK